MTINNPIFIIACKKKGKALNPFDFNSDNLHYTMAEATLSLSKMTNDDWDKTQYFIKEVDECFIYLYLHANKDLIELESFTDDKEDRTSVCEFFDTVYDENLYPRYILNIFRTDSEPIYSKNIYLRDYVNYLEDFIS